MTQTIENELKELQTNKFQYKRMVLFEELHDRVKYNVNLPEIKRRYLPKVQLTDIELEFLKALVDGRNQREINAALNFLGEKRSYYQIMATILNKFKALNLSNAIYKACKLGII